MALDYSKEKSALSDEEKDEESFRIVKTFFDRIPKIREYLETDLMATFEGDPSADNYEEIILAFPGLYAITVYRMAHELYVEKVPVLPRLMTEYAHSLNVKIYQGVTIGALSTRGGQRLSGKKRHPTICDNVTIYANASILGGETVIGENSVIGGNSFITASIKPNSKVSTKIFENEYKTEGNKVKSEEVKQGDEWFYII